MGVRRMRRTYTKVSFHLTAVCKQPSFNSCAATNEEAPDIKLTGGLQIQSDSAAQRLMRKPGKL